MNLEAEILKEHSKKQVDKIVHWIGNDKNHFKKLMELFLNGEHLITQRTAWVLSHCGEKHPELVIPWIKPMVKKMQEPGVHDAVPRNVLRLLQFTNIPQSLLGTLVSLCFEFLQSLEAPIAVKVYSMTILLNVAKKEKSIGNELKLVLEQIQPYIGPALKARSRIVFEKLSKF
jgi:hypothetical protein